MSYIGITFDTQVSSLLNEMVHASLLSMLGPDYMRRAGPVSRAGVSLPGSRHVC